jgi:hypothetical protein
VLRFETQFLYRMSIEFFQINGFEKHSEIAPTPPTDGADTYYREGRFVQQALCQTSCRLSLAAMSDISQGKENFVVFTGLVGSPEGYDRKPRTTEPI